jgi:hypothetical protein
MEEMRNSYRIMAGNLQANGLLGRACLVVRDKECGDAYWIQVAQEGLNT